MIPLNLLTPNADQQAPVRRRPTAPLPQLPSARPAEPQQAPEPRGQSYAEPLRPLRAPPPQVSRAAATEDVAGDTNKRFEQMLWAEMLRHTGIEEAFTSAGGQAAAAFTQFAVEAIARDLAEKHPLGFNAVDRADEAYESSRTLGESA
ncbi:hypothetical protein [Henriciella marina]|uniref:hypothetical protein n=1 Tax=Henriciella marina TaxID=453851 RepID=UPI000381708D|nr:hypothetical protein [Henriciella marina]